MLRAIVAVSILVLAKYLLVKQLHGMKVQVLVTLILKYVQNANDAWYDRWAKIAAYVQTSGFPSLLGLDSWRTCEHKIYMFIVNVSLRPRGGLQRPQRLVHWRRRRAEGPHGVHVGQGGKNGVGVMPVALFIR